jgi:ADP-dependent NAD(P)H-hydrate dehydratase
MSASSVRGGRTAAQSVTPGWLARHPLPEPDPDGDKEGRGHACIVAGCREMPGPAILAATAALRAGAGKLTVVTAADVAPGLALALPESRVIAARARADGGMRDLSGIDLALFERASAILVGPGMQDGDTSAAIVRAIVGRCPQTPTVLDAAAMDCVLRVDGLHPHTLVTPHAGELAHLTGRSKESLVDDPERSACDAAAQWGVLVLLKGATTVLAGPRGLLWRHRCRLAGLGTSGSGDTLAGIITGIASRGVPMPAAAAWGVALHARSARRLVKRVGPLGYLARELVDEVPRAAVDLARGRPSS